MQFMQMFNCAIIAGNNDLGPGCLNRSHQRVQRMKAAVREGFPNGAHLQQWVTRNWANSRNIATDARELDRKSCGARPPTGVRQ
jgi:hypothetical protein